MTKYIEATQESGKEFYQQFHDKGKITMLNLLKFKAKADYTDLDDIKPEVEITGEEAYRLYMEHTTPFLEEAGGKVLYFGKSSSFLIGPASIKWDAVLLVEHQSVEKFMAFAQNKDYLSGAGHRSAALEDSRLLPSTEFVT